MVHQTISTSSTRASSASSRMSSMSRSLWNAAIVGMLAGCASVPLPRSDEVPARPPAAPHAPADTAPLPAPLLQGKSRWQPVPWSELPGFGEDALHEAWNAWLKSCERPGAAFAAMCPEVRRLSIGSGEDQRAWMMQRLQPYRVEPLAGPAEGLLTGYYEPVLEASRQPTALHQVPLYRPPVNLAGRRPWYTRQEIEALALQVQGSGESAWPNPTAACVPCGWHLPPATSNRTAAWAAGCCSKARCAMHRGPGSRPGRPRTRSASRRCCGAIRGRCSSVRSRSANSTRPLARAGRRECR